MTSPRASGHASFTDRRATARQHTEDRALEDIVKERLAVLFRRFGAAHLKDLHPMVIHRVEKALIVQVLAQTQGCRIRAAKILGLSRNTLRRKMDEYKIDA